MNIKQRYLVHVLEYLLILKTKRKETTVGNILDLSQSKYARGLMDSEVYLSVPCLQTSPRVNYDLGNKKLGVWNF